MSQSAKKKVVERGRRKSPSSSGCHPIGLEFRDDGDANRFREFLEMEPEAPSTQQELGGEDEETPQ